MRCGVTPDLSVSDSGADLRRGAWLVWSLSSLAALGVAWSTMGTFFKGVMPAELFTGWGLAAGNAVLAVIINVTAMRKKREGFVAWGAIGNVLRALGVLAIILCVKWLGPVKFEPFITAFMASYFVFMFTETVRLNFLNLRSKR